MKKLILVLTLIVSFNTVLLAEKITISYFVTSPHINVNAKDKSLSGALYELLQNHIAPETGDTFVWASSPAPVPRLIVNLKENKTDAVALLAFSPERAKTFRYSKASFYAGNSGIAVKTENPLSEITKIEDILDMRIGYAKKTFISPFMRDKRIKFDLVGTGNFLEVNIKKILAGRMEAAYSPDLAGLLSNIKSLDVDDKFKVLKLPERAAAFHVVFSKNAENKAARFDKALDKLGGADFYLKLLSKYLDTSKL